MNTLAKQMEVILSELETGTTLMNVAESEQVLNALYHTKRIFLAGSGRSGLAIRAFANRLLHLGKTVYMVGDITTPSIQAGDVLFIGSGSGETAGIIVNAKKAKQSGATVILNTTNSQSTLGKLADYLLVIKVDNKETDTNAMESSVQPMGSAFEQLSLLLYDAIVLEWAASFNVTHDDMKLRHANLE
ncbi:hypothetical protein A8L34_27470 [Bacillus sp. FJAT-27264]|uniref:6-phospho-3-hexuloisomerase n=1 Tax=Paenibacillus sp. (strain DSM 101736 / FJAT-27264) TaxID=1850362 RepID=UPI000807D335|nr:6-phospho-3-hexuloisomerase [Bacillus sp. FJAT-27264]OBZ16171.1 hypothetical protein A8L34_27470 [Bacillus sp. FJAT-27264]